MQMIRISGSACPPAYIGTLIWWVKTCGTLCGNSYHHLSILSPPRLRWSNMELACDEKSFPATIFRPLDVCFLWVSQMFVLAGQYVSLWRSMEDKSQLWVQSHLSRVRVGPTVWDAREKTHLDPNSHCVVSANKYHYCKWIKFGVLA